MWGGDTSGAGSGVGSSAAAGAAAGSVAGPVGAVAGALIGAAGSYFSGKSSADFAERAYKHRYQWQVKDLKKAGLNPMLAYMNPAPNVPQPNFPNVGEGALKGASAVQAMRVANAQMENIGSDTALKIASARAQDAQTQKTQVETGLLGEFGSARQGAEIKQIEQNIRESIQRVSESDMRISTMQQEFLHNEANNPIIRDLNAALADAKRAEVPLKEVVGMLAGMFGELIRNARTETERRDYSTLGRDTINMVEDKWNSWNPWERFKAWDRQKRGIK